MKLYKFIIVGAAAVLAIASCAKENFSEDNVLQQKRTIIKASLVESETKTAVTEDGAYTWLSGDKISVFNTAGIQCPSAFVAQASGANVDFEGQKASTSDVLKFGLYPYDPEAQCTSAGVISTTIPTLQDGNISTALSVAVSSNGVAFPFVNASSIVKITFNAADDIRYARIDFPSAVTGDVTVDCTTGAISGAKCKTVIINSESALDGVKYLAIAPASKGAMKFTFRNGSGKTAIKNAEITTDFLAGHLKSIGTVKNLSFEETVPTLRDFAEGFVTALTAWEENIGRVDADASHNGAATGWKNVHFIPIGVTPGNAYGTSGNQYASGLKVWDVVIGDKTYNAAQAWEIALRGLMNLVTAEGEAFLPGMTSRNKAYTLANNASFMSAAMPSASANCKWGATPWYEVDKAVTKNGAAVKDVDINFLIKCGSWHIVRGLITNAGNTALGNIGNYQEFGTNSGSQLVLDGYSGFIAPIRELLIAARIYKYILDNSIDENVYDAIKDQRFDFSLYGVDIDPLSLKTTNLEVPGDASTGKTVSFVARDLWTATTNVDWITLTKGNGGASDAASVKFDIEANLGNAREGTVSIMSGDQTVSFVVRQAKTSATKFYIKDFAKELVKLIDVWENTYDNLKIYSGDAEKQYGVHCIPQSTTMTFGETTYNYADIFEIALRSYLLVNGYDGTIAESSVKGAGAFDSKKLDVCPTMSGTQIPSTHSYILPDELYCETKGNGGFLNGTSGASNVMKSFLYNYACRNTNYPLSNSNIISRIGGYNAAQVSGITGSCSFQRAILTFAYFFKYMLDNNLEVATEISSSQTFTSTLFGPEVFKPNALDNNAIWSWGGDMEKLPLGQLATNGIGTIFLNEAAVTSFGTTKVKDFITKAASYGIGVHMWMQAFYSGGQWVCPVDAANECYNQTRFDEVINSAKSYIDLGAAGIHFDYLRFPGTESNKASLHNYKGGTVTGSGAVTEFCRQANVALKAYDSDVILSCALMPEKNSQQYYGQIPAYMGAYLDVLVPMVYRYSNDTGSDKGASWAADMASWFVSNSGGADVWTGITTYKGENTVTGMTAEQIKADCNVFSNCGTKGVVLFRFTLGAIPDLTDLWD